MWYTSPGVDAWGSGLSPSRPQNILEPKPDPSPGFQARLDDSITINDSFYLKPRRENGVYSVLCEIAVVKLYRSGVQGKHQLGTFHQCASDDPKAALKCSMDRWGPLLSEHQHTVPPTTAVCIALAHARILPPSARVGLITSLWSGINYHSKLSMKSMAELEICKSKRKRICTAEQCTAGVERRHCNFGVAHLVRRDTLLEGCRRQAGTAKPGSRYILEWAGFLFLRCRDVEIKCAWHSIDASGLPADCDPPALISGAVGVSEGSKSLTDSRLIQLI
ncbi:hypothetical protein B0H19DRAFT_1086546 [Mycena capillaripes]|nr:hypothetical protein B0H19DRAFT_1086546 [Mycena capillaripes]